MRPFWATYFKNTDAVVMVIDSTDRARVGVAKVSLRLRAAWWVAGKLRMRTRHGYEGMVGLTALRNPVALTRFRSAVTRWWVQL